METLSHFNLHPHACPLHKRYKSVTRVPQRRNARRVGPADPPRSLPRPGALGPDPVARWSAPARPLATLASPRAASPPLWRPRPRRDGSRARRVAAAVAAAAPPVAQGVRVVGAAAENMQHLRMPVLRMPAVEDLGQVVLDASAACRPGRCSRAQKVARAALVDEEKVVRDQRHGRPQLRDVDLVRRARTCSAPRPLCALEGQARDTRRGMLREVKIGRRWAAR